MKGRSTAAAARWLSDALARIDVGDERAATEALSSRIGAEPPAFRIALLKACVDRLPSLRMEARTDRSAYRLGSVLYGVACALYGDRLPHDEDDICDLLRASKHDCGHGADVGGAFDLAIDHARRFGVSRQLLEALGTFVAGLSGLQSVKAQNLKRRAALVFVLDTEGCLDTRPCWSDRFRLGLAALAVEERVSWHRLVLQMSVSEKPRLPGVWRRTSSRFIDALGLVHTLERFADWWPTPRPEPWTLESGGSQLLRHFVWMLQVMREQASSEERPLCDGLVAQLAFLDWKPRDRAKKVVVAAASYLVECTPDIASEPLQRLSHWSTALKYADWESNRIAVLAREFARVHGLDATMFATPHVVEKPDPPAHPPPDVVRPASGAEVRSNVPGLSHGPDAPQRSSAPETWYGRLVISLRRALWLGRGAR